MTSNILSFQEGSDTIPSLGLRELLFAAYLLLCCTLNTTSVGDKSFWLQPQFKIWPFGVSFSAYVP